MKEARTRSTSGESVRSSSIGSTTSASWATTASRSGAGELLSAQVRGLTERHELIGKRRFQVAEHRLESLGREERERLNVLLAGGRVDRVNGRGRREQTILRDEADDGLVQRHGSGLHAGASCELLGQSREASVQQAVEALLDEVRHLRGSERDALETQGDVDRVESSDRVETLGLVILRIQEDRAVGNRAKPLFYRRRSSSSARANAACTCGTTRKDTGGCGSIVP